MSINKIKYDELEEIKGKNEILINLLNKLIAFDKKRIFLYPVNVELVPDYLNIIKEPMDFTTMKHKIQNYKYNDFNEFEKDVYLIINNCYTYNDKSTIYHRVAENLENYYKKISIKMHKRFMNIHYLYHKDKNIINSVASSANANNVKKSYLKEKKKNEKTKKHGKVGRPCKLNADSKNSYYNNSNEFINASYKKKRISNKNLSKGIEHMYNNFVNNAVVSYTPNFVNNIYENNNSAYPNLENIIEEEDFNIIINKIQDSHDKSNDIFHLLIKMLSNNTNNHPILCNYVNINKSLREIFFEDTMFSKSKNYEYFLTDSDDNSVQSSKTNRKRKLCDVPNNLSKKNTKYELLNEKQVNNYNKYKHSESNIHFENDNKNLVSNKDIAENRKSYSINNHDMSENINNNKNLNENYNELSNNNDNLFKNKHVKDTNGKINDYFLKKKKFVHEKNKLLKETVTCNIEKEELTMNLLNYKESVKKFIGESNFPTFIKIFPNIYTILDNADVKDLYYSAFNDLRIFGLDLEDFVEFNNKITYNENYLLGIGKYHINNIFTLDKNLSNIIFDEKYNSHFSDEYKTYLSNNKNSGKNSLLCYNNSDNRYSIKSNMNLILNDKQKIENKNISEMKNKCKTMTNKNHIAFNSSRLSSYHNNNNDSAINKSDTDTDTDKEKKKKEITNDHYHNINSFNNKNNFEYEPNSYNDYEFSCESSSDNDENLNLKNFFFTYNSYINEFYKKKKRKF
ncbi:bromodomain protein, putative [Plasmodium relictum]|uniref:Bromodomain protein, putative n=1 Tax=Plasmodium relictum TaxID=85471 RepID=A0A1J1H9S7_PLARL|nr:bromodomain protein, putative [Plasmodium relictum]CRH01559.1 bromodomain protein, putative [Plasmodium relictum]